MLYVIIGEDHPGTLDQRMAARPSHVERLQALQAEARLILAGPCPAIDSPDWADADPYVAAGVYAKVTVKPFKKVLPA